MRLPEQNIDYPKQISVAIIGNAKSGKSALFESIVADGEREEIDGVMVGRCLHNGYTLSICELPGTYALSHSTAEGSFVRRYILDNVPDVVLNVVCSTALEQQLFMTTELIDMNQNIVVALNKYDELESSGATLDYQLLGQMMGLPMIPVVGNRGRGVEQLIDTIVAAYEGKEPRRKHIHISQGIAEQSVAAVDKVLKADRDQLPKAFPPRYYAIKLLENDRDIVSLLQELPSYDKWQRVVKAEQEHLKYDLGQSEDIESTISNQKYGFISGALRETYKKARNSRRELSNHIDEIVTHKIWGYPIFLLIMWAMFYCTFSLGQYPQQWIESGVTLLSQFLDGVMSEGVLKDLIVDGIVGGVGSVIVFLPNIMILYLFIAFMEDSGYLSRAAFIMDKLMHNVGLHGKSFIPLVMGFGCNVPAVLATKSIESHSSRVITALILPFMSCSARLPVYILFLGSFFGKYSGTILFGLYLLGIAVAMITARLMRRLKFSADETPFVMELSPYRLPTLRATVSHMWDRVLHYIKNLSGVILVASVIIWALSYFPINDGQMSEQQHFEQSYIGKIGKACEPVFEPLGLNWKSSVAVISGIAAKEIVVSTIGVLYNDDDAIAALETDEESLHGRLTRSGDFTTASVLALLVFTLLYFPCLATLAAIWTEYGKGWALFSALYSTAVAWVLAFVTYHITNLLC